MDELNLTCRICGHEEHGEALCSREIKQRMRWHLEMFHPGHDEPFKEIVQVKYERTIGVYT